MDERADGISIMTDDGRDPMRGIVLGVLLALLTFWAPVLALIWAVRR